MKGDKKERNGREDKWIKQRGVGETVAKESGGGQGDDS